MRYERGGSLYQLLHEKSRTTSSSSSSSSSSTPNKTNKQHQECIADHHVLSMTEKLRILKEVARGLAELHSAGIVHGDVKAENVLLSDDLPPKVRLADFGMSSVCRKTNTNNHNNKKVARKESAVSISKSPSSSTQTTSSPSNPSTTRTSISCHHKKVNFHDIDDVIVTNDNDENDDECSMTSHSSSASSFQLMTTLALTSRTRGTPIYCAPEMLVNPYKEIVDPIVSKSSRKTDM